MADRDGQPAEAPQPDLKYPCGPFSWWPDLAMVPAGVTWTLARRTPAGGGLPPPYDRPVPDQRQRHRRKRPPRNAIA